jgi:hypothetical protein
MTWRQLGSILLNLMGVVVPAFVVFRVFGSDATILSAGGPEASKQGVVIALSVLFAFVSALAGSTLLRRSGPPTLLDLLEKLSDHDPERRKRAARHPP